jgi:hypothetical protein
MAMTNTFTEPSNMQLVFGKIDQRIFNSILNALVRAEMGEAEVGN